MRPNPTLPLVLAALALSPVADAGWKLKPGKTKIESLPSGGASPDLHSSHAPTISADGKQLLFMSNVAELTGDTSYPGAQILWRNRETGATSIVSLTKAGAPIPVTVQDARISADGEYAVFTTAAADIVDGITIPDVEGHHDVFRVHLATNTIVRVSVTHDLKEPDKSCGAPDISADGRYVVFTTPASNMLATPVAAEVQVYRKDMHTGDLALVSAANGGASGDDNSIHPRISADGQRVTFSSRAANFGAAPAGGAYECWVRDMQAGTTEHASPAKQGGASEEGAIGAVISGHGRYVAFTSRSNDLPGGAGKDGESLYVRDLKKGKTVRVPVAAKTGAVVSATSFSSSRYLTFTRSTLGDIRMYVYDVKKGKVQSIGRNSKGKKANGPTWRPAISANGKVVAFQSRATNLGPDKDEHIDVFVRRWK